MKIPTTQQIEKKIRLHYINGKTRIVVVEDIFLRIFGIDLIIPKGLISDGASFPKIFFGLDPFDERGILGALLHDYLYKTQFVGRIIADLIFAYGLTITAGKFYAITFYSGLRGGGGFSGRNNQKKGLLKFPEAKERLRKYQCGNYYQNKKKQND